MRGQRGEVRSTVGGRRSAVQALYGCRGGGHGIVQGGLGVVGVLVTLPSTPVSIARRNKCWRRHDGRSRNSSRTGVLTEHCCQLSGRSSSEKVLELL